MKPRKLSSKVDVSLFCCLRLHFMLFVAAVLFSLKFRLANKAAPCQKKNSKRENDSLDSDGFSGKGNERGHGTKIFVENQTDFS